MTETFNLKLESLPEVNGLKQYIVIMVFSIIYYNCIIIYQNASLLASFVS